MIVPQGKIGTIIFVGSVFAGCLNFKALNLLFAGDTLLQRFVFRELLAFELVCG